MRVRLFIVIGLLAFAYWSTQKPTPVEPKPEPSAAIDLRGVFVGEDGARDAATVAALCDELADVIEYDHKTGAPCLTTGVALDALRVNARRLRTRGESLGDKYPRLATKVAEYLDQELGNAGGPVTEEQLVKWVKSYREIAKAARFAIN